MTPDFHPIPVVLGPTASGKTSVGIELSKLIDGEVVSVDSRKVYKGLPVGTATPKGEWKDGVTVVQGIPHHLIAHLQPDTVYTAGDFAQEADQRIDQILARGKTPVLVGGTGFYFKALQKGLPELPPRQPALRAELMKLIEEGGRTALHQELANRDPQAARAINPADTHKLIRAVEVCRLMADPFSKGKERRVTRTTRSFIVMGLHMPKALLDIRIEERSRHMLENGMIQETRAVLDRGFSKSCAALSSFGYKEAVQVIEGRMSETEFLARLIHGTKAYAKRQRTWFRTQVKPVWFECNEHSKKDEIALKMRAFMETRNLYNSEKSMAEGNHITDAN